MFISHDGCYPFFFFLIMLGGEVTCIESMDGAEFFGEKIQHILKLSVLKQNIMSQPFDHQVYKYKLATVPTFSWPGYLQFKHMEGFSLMISGTIDKWIGKTIQEP